MQKQIIGVMIWIILSVKYSYTVGNSAWTLSTEQTPSHGSRRLITSGSTTMLSDFKYNNESETKEVTLENSNIYDAVGYYDYSYYNEGLYGDNMTFDKIDKYLNKTVTMTFLSSFPNDLQRETIRQQLRYCPHIRLCNFYLGVEKIETNYSCCAACSCDYPSCLRYQSCCPDILHFSMFHLATEGDKSNDKQNINSSENDDIPLTCTLLHAKVLSSHVQLSAYIHATCPSETDKTLANLCTRQYTKNISSIQDMVPVTTSDGMVTYRNKYCALCNGISENKIDFWNVSLSCDKNSDKNNTFSTFMQSEKRMIDFIFSNDICDLAFSGKYSKRVRKCKTAISRCNETGLWKKYDPKLEVSCSLYTSIIHAYSMMFQNVFCLQCNGYEPKLPLKVCDENEGFGMSFSFSGLIKMKSFTGVGDKKQPISACNESGIYDKTTGKCLPIFCNEFYTLQNQQCVKTFESIRNVIYVLYFRFIPVQNTTIFETHLLTEDILDYIQMHIFENPKYFSAAKFHICGAQFIYRADLTFLSNNSNNEVSGSNLLNIDARFELFFGDHDPYEVTQTLNNLDTFEIAISSQTGQREMKFRIIVRDDSLNFAYDVVDILSNMESDDHSVEIRSRGITLLSELIRYAAADENNFTVIPYINRNNNFMYCSGDIRKVKALAIRECSVLKLSITDSQLKEVDGESMLVYKDVSFFSSEFAFENKSTVLVCVKTFRRYLNQTQTKLSVISNVNDIEKPLSIVCVSLSIVGLFITLTTFALFPCLRTFPGMNTVCLCLFLLVAQSVYLIASFAKIKEQTICCQTVGIALHFSWLATIFWMNICTFHMFRVLTHTSARFSTKWSLFAIYHIYTFVLSCTCIILNIGLSLYFSDNIGYGQGLCYISSEVMQMYTFGLPVLLVVLANIAMFSAVVISVKRKSSIHRTSSDERNNFLILTKLSSLTGSTWLFGFIYYWTDVSVFSFIFTILNSSQGIFLMLSFVINKRILDLYRASIQNWREHHWTGTGTGTYNVKSHGTDCKTITESGKLKMKYKHTENKTFVQTTSL